MVTTNSYKNTHFGLIPRCFERKLYLSSHVGWLKTAKKVFKSFENSVEDVYKIARFSPCFRFAQKLFHGLHRIKF